MPGRRRADALAAKATLSPTALADSEQLRQWHQQQASQIELDLQQHVLAALQSERDLAQADRVHYATLYDQSPAGYLSLDADGRIVRANQAAAMLLEQRHDDLAGLPLEYFASPAARPRLRRFVANLFASGARAVLELPLAPPPKPGQVPGRAPRRLRIEANLDAVARRGRLILTDLGTVGRRDAARLRAFEVLDNLGEGVLVCDRAQRIVAVNPAFTRLTGYPAEDVLGRSPRFLLRPGAARHYAAAVQALRRGCRWLGEPEGRRRDGSRFVASLSLTAVYDDDGAIDYFIAVFSDISARRQAETALRALSGELDARVVLRTTELAAANQRLLEEVDQHKRTAAQLQRSRAQLSRLAAHQETVREEERQRVARDIHDELGQNLLALRIEMTQLQGRTGPAGGRLRQRVDLALENLDATIRSVRGIMNELRPAVLDLGLSAALEWQVQQFRHRSGIACALELPPEAQVPSLPAPLQMALFRNLQEALVNVRRHAQASAVRVQLAQTTSSLTLSISDDGVGLDPARRADGDGFGLIAMEQRMAALGGRLLIDTPPSGRGCRLTLSFDL
ncbi:PAS domain S-box protein [Duganella sp. FT94W]|uniref:PAS domain S-box protein n=1 Tax=Duganella lactea TaxID=2692173 RepID=A0ABW9VBP5_9BURK|nr:PAS domain S-box protein [Duganella lactea]MYM36327.1 PAS domain S-box protein [Duganella lactea]